MAVSVNNFLRSDRTQFQNGFVPFWNDFLFGIAEIVILKIDVRNYLSMALGEELFTTPRLTHAPRRSSQQ